MYLCWTTAKLAPPVSGYMGEGYEAGSPATFTGWGQLLFLYWEELFWSIR